MGQDRESAEERVGENKPAATASSKLIAHGDRDKVVECGVPVSAGGEGARAIGL